MKRSGFTVVEVMAALAITGMVALISYGAFRTVLDTGDRIASFREGTEAAALTRNVLSGALRHVTETAVPGRPYFELTHSIGRAGLPADHLSFLSRGISRPLGASALWSVDLRLSSEGMRFTAVPVDSGAPGGLATTLKGVAGLRVRPLDSGANDFVREDWSSREPLPAGVLVEFLRADGSPALSPVFVRLAGETFP